MQTYGHAIEPCSVQRASFENDPAIGISFSVDLNDGNNCRKHLVSVAIVAYSKIVYFIRFINVSESKVINVELICFSESNSFPYVSSSPIADKLKYIKIVCNFDVAVHLVFHKNRSIVFWADSFYKTRK
jgi:hypothetical protein